MTTEEQPAKQLGGVTGRGFMPGQSGNPGGRPKGFLHRVKEVTGGDDFPKLAEGLAVIAFGDAHQRLGFFGEPITVTTGDRLRAMEMLRDSGPGRPATTLEHQGMQAAPLFALPPGVMPGIAKEKG